MGRKLLHLLNGLITFVVTVSLVVAGAYAGYALWDNQQIYDAAENVFSEMKEIRNTMTAPTLSAMEQLIEEHKAARAAEEAERAKLAEEAAAAKAEAPEKEAALSPESVAAEAVDISEAAENTPVTAAEVSAEPITASAAGTVEITAAVSGETENTPAGMAAANEGTETEATVGSGTDNALAAVEAHTDMKAESRTEAAEAGETVTAENTAVDAEANTGIHASVAVESTTDTAETSETAIAESTAVAAAMTTEAPAAVVAEGQPGEIIVETATPDADTRADVTENTEQTEQTAAAAISAAATAAPTEMPEPAEPEIPDDSPFGQLKAINPDITAWITMSGTAIDYPVMQGSSNYSYINTDVYGNFALAGSIFLDSRNDANYEDLYSLLYGHNMSQHRMFSDINLYKDQDFFDKNRLGLLMLPDGCHILESISVIVAPASNSGLFNPENWTYLDGEGILRMAQEDAVFICDEGLEALKAQIEAGENPRLVSLSTCSDEFTDARTILLTLMDP